MKKKILFIILILSLFVTKVYALGTFDNPDHRNEFTDFDLSLSDMNEYDDNGMYIGERTLYYYVFEVNVEEPSTVYFSTSVPTEKDKYGGSVFVEMILPATSIDDQDMYVIEGYSEQFKDNKDWIDVNSFLKPGKYYLVLGTYINDGSTSNYEFTVSYGVSEDAYKWELEPNNNLTIPFMADINRMYSGFVDVIDNIDVFSVNLTAGKKARVYINDYEEYNETEEPVIEGIICKDSSSLCEGFSFEDLIYDPSRAQYYYEFMPETTEEYYVEFSGYGDYYEFFYYALGVYQDDTIAPGVLEDIDYYDEYYTDEYTLSVYRLYNKFTGEHLYTTDANEAKVLYKDHGWGFEGIGWYSTTEGIAIYRLYNPGLGNHLYTSDENEINELTTKHGWVKDNDGKPVMYSTGDEDDVPIYRVYNEGMSGMHHLTTDENEYNALPDYGWQQEGISMYASWFGNPCATDFYNVKF